MDLPPSLEGQTQAAFSHVMAAKYAGLGTIGLANCLLTPEFDPGCGSCPSSLAALLEPDPVIEKDLCIKCEACVKCCPVNALTLREDR